MSWGVLTACVVLLLISFGLGTLLGSGDALQGHHRVHHNGLGLNGTLDRLVGSGRSRIGGVGKAGCPEDPSDR